MSAERAQRLNEPVRFDVLLEAAINGGRSAGEHPALPLTPAALAREARAAVAAGAGAIHLHARDAAGAESLAADDVAAALAAVRDACPATPVGVGTDAWAAPDPAERVAAIGAWTALPDFASVNFHEARAAEVAGVLLARGVGVEAGLWHRPAAERLVASGLGPRCLRVLVEPMQPDAEAALANAAAIEAVLTRARIDRPRLLHGTGATAWPLLAAAGARGLAVRIGFEDVLELPDGTPAPDNGALVSAARTLLARAGR